ncbi:hypothetical protein PROH_05340 [Prochlorothrix hollandica PCC 9006 = CALU 1027]|uniref:Uncharacterized protein n=1 Tax=Prochlorothrix hollandica PCC 9006 = CALU 1027 TaxID=317619 RepID=A0A0M2PX07_PROHO|nr:hypothetical protein PROH_05340 [Prochlorothrix hollandica PCC 9006 = CALU 1027]
MPTLLATHDRGNHGGIAPTKIGEPTPGDPQPVQPRGDCPYQNRGTHPRRPATGATTGGLPLPKSGNPTQ